MSTIIAPEKREEEKKSTQSRAAAAAAAADAWEPQLSCYYSRFSVFPCIYARVYTKRAKRASFLGRQAGKQPLAAAIAAVL